MKTFLVALAALLVAALFSGCASYSGRGLVPGQSSAKDVETLMGRPAERLTIAGGDSVWYYPRGPFGKETFAVRLNPQGVVVSVEQRLTVENVRKLVPGVSTTKDVRELFGPPSQVQHMRLQQREAWRWLMDNGYMIDHFLVVQFSADGIVREVMMIRHPKYDAGDGRA
jgi:outer membrane protein assembly factor BamE (lipoprotein component of BamABCDE complex)